MRLAIVLLAALSIVSVARADDPDARTRRARAALALAGGPKVVATAPAPHPVTPKDYATGYRDAHIETLPLVVYIGLDPEPVAGAVVCKANAPEFGGVTGPAVVVGYPRGDRLYIDETLKGTPTPQAVKKAVDAAARKIDAPTPPKPMPIAPKPLNWQIAAPRYYYPPACVGVV